MDRADTLGWSQARTMLHAITNAASAPVSIVVVDDHGEPIASVRMDGAPLDTYLNASRKAYTAARSDQLTTHALAQKAGGSASDIASFDPRFCFFQGGVAILSGGRRIGAVGVSGLPGPDDEAVARAGISAAGLDAPP
jgi:glc operon protein GlcG